MTMESCLLKCDSVFFGYRDVPILKGVSMAVTEGAFLGVIGPNGVGKSTLIRVLTNTLPPKRGTVLLDGQPLATLTRRAIAQKLAVVSQTDTSDFGFTVWEEVMLGRSPHHGGIHYENLDDRAIVEMALEKTQIAHLASRRLDTLSGGERQRVRIARAIAQQPVIVFLDEPTTHLDLYSQLTLMELLKDINKQGIAVFLVSHDINFVAQSCADVHLMHDGAILVHGAPREVITPDRVATCFRIRADVFVDPKTSIPRINPLGILKPDDDFVGSPLNRDDR